MLNKTRPGRRSRRATGFTLVELVIVIGIIALLMSLLIPALSKARESANLTRCSNNLRQAGISIRAFAQDHDGRVPYTQCGPGTPTPPIWDNVMYSHDYFELVDRYGLNTKLLLCPSSVTAASEAPPTTYQSGAQTETQARQASGLLTNTPANIPQLGPAADPENPTFPGNLSTYYVNLSCYAYMGFNSQWGQPATQGTPPPKVNFWVRRITSQTTTGTLVDSSPPLMADQTIYQPGGVGYVYNHGRNWAIPSVSGTGTASAHDGTPMINVLYTDNHVDSKAPDNTAYLIMSGNAYCYR